MRYFLRGQLHWLALVAGILVLAAGVAASLWLVQRPGAPGPEAIAIEEDAGPAPARETGAGINTTDGQSGGPALLGLPARESPTTGDAPGPSFADAATLGDSVELVLQETPPAPAGGGPKESAAVGDSVELVIRDASGKVK